MRYLLLPLLLFLSISLTAQDAEKISNCFMKGDASTLSSHFDSSIDMNIPGNSGIYQKDQAKVILSKFFSANATTQYEMKHEGGSKQKSMFHIGKLQTESGSYRTYLLYNSVEGVMQIIELRIEEE